MTRRAGLRWLVVLLLILGSMRPAQAAISANLNDREYGKFQECGATGIPCVTVQGSATGTAIPISGTVTSTPSGTQNVTGTGTAGAAATGVVTVQGIASMTAVKVDGSGVTQPVSGGGSTGAAVPATAVYVAGNGSGNATGLITCDSSVSVSISTATTTQLVALASSKKIYVCAFVLDLTGSATANTVQFEYGTGAACGAGTTVLTGAMAGNGVATAPTVIAQGSGTGSLFSTIASNALCLVTTQAVQVSGYISYTQF